MARFRRLFRNESEDTRLEVVVGNHDIGFHNRMSSSRIRYSFAVSNTHSTHARTKSQV